MCCCLSPVWLPVAQVSDATLVELFLLSECVALVGTFGSHFSKVCVRLPSSHYYHHIAGSHSHHHITGSHFSKVCAPPPVITWKHSRSLVSVRVYERKRESCKTHQVVCIKVRIGQRPLVVKPHTGSCPLRSRRTHAHPGVGRMPPWCTRLIQVLAAFPHGALGFELWNVLSLTRPPHHCINWAGGI